MHLTVIAKAPVPGRVKTRLTPPLDPHQAAAVAAAALRDTVDAVDRAHARCAARGVRPRRVLLFDGPTSGWVPRGWDVVAQRGDGLAARLADGFTRLGPGVVVGMDTPGCGPWLPAAVDAVRSGHDVLGLATDGGYWVIGLACPHPTLFAGVPMSRAHTGVAQLARLHAAGRSVRLLPAVRDLDDVTDLRAAASHDDGRLGTVAREVLATFDDRASSPPTAG